MIKYVHTNIVAEDWKSLSQFYIDVFDCKEKPPERNFSGQWLDRATGLQDATLEGIHLILPGYGDSGPTLEIFSYGSIVESGDSMANKKGFSHIAFLVDDVEQTYKYALANGASELGQITVNEVENVGKLTFVYFKDPEGNIIEIQSWD